MEEIHGRHDEQHNAHTDNDQRGDQPHEYAKHPRDCDRCRFESDRLRERYGYQEGWWWDLDRG